MQTNFEQFALTSMLGQQDSPPRLEGKLCFGQDWERQAFGVALALSRSGHFDWEDFRQQLIAAIREWEESHDLNDNSWDYYERWLTALERIIIERQLVRIEELANTPVSCNQVEEGGCHAGPVDSAAAEIETKLAPSAHGGAS